jgi:hypothetical protein
MSLWSFMKEYVYAYFTIYVPPKMSSRTPAGTRTPGWISLLHTPPSQVEFCKVWASLG